MKSDQINAFVSLFIVIVLTASCFLAVIESTDGANNTGQTYDIEMNVGDSFSYVPSVNLSGATITASGTAMETNSGFLSYSGVGTALTGTATAPGTYTAVLTATYVGEVTQTATQTVNFTVYTPVHITGTQDTYGIIGQTYSNTLSVTGPSDVIATTTFSQSNCGLTAIYSANVLTISGSLDATAGTDITATVTASSELSGDSYQYVVTVHPYDDLAITSGSTIYTYVGHSTTYEITTNHDTTSGASITLSADTSAITSEIGTATISGSVITMDFTAAAVADTYTDYSIIVGASGTLEGIDFTAASQAVTVRCYASLVFVDSPVADNVTAVAATGNPQQMVLSTAITGATTVTYTWGDGIVTVINPSTTGTAVYTTTHSYASAGVYNINITASNDVGSTTQIIMYNAGAGVIEIGADAADSSNIILDFIGQYWTWIVPILMVVGGALAACYGLVHPLVIIDIIIGALAIIIQIGMVFL